MEREHDKSPAASDSQLCPYQPALVHLSNVGEALWPGAGQVGGKVTAADSALAVTPTISGLGAMDWGMTYESISTIQWEVQVWGLAGELEPRNEEGLSGCSRS